uniref:Uncharacterized protein n=1 Tax=Romanomermis culicivorax TaxID=13658 RepID=A0A915L3V2_ROMCU
YSLPFFYYFFCIVSLVVVRILLTRKNDEDESSSEIEESDDSSPIYAALYFYPFLILAHAVFAGLIYYYFPYILLIVCLIANALHLGALEDQTFKGILRTVVTNRRSTISIVVLSLAYIYAIIAVSNIQNLILPACLMLFVPVPTLFYAASAPFSKPSNLNFVGSSRTVNINNR